MPTSPIGEVMGFPTEIIKASAFQAKRKVRVDWADRYNWAMFFLYNGPNTNNYPYFVYAGLPTSSDIVQIAIEPDVSTRLTHLPTDVNPTGAAGAVYENALMTLVYQSAGFDAEGILIEEFIPRIETQHLASEYLCWSDGTPLGSQAPTLYTPGYELRITYPRRKLIPGIAAYTARTNIDSYHCKLFPWHIKPYCGLYMGAGMKAVYGYDGTQSYEVSHSIWVRDVNWNMDWNPIYGGWSYLYNRSGFPIIKYASAVFTGNI